MLLEGLTIGYNIAEAIIAITAGIFAGSVALVGFGFDSIIEVIAATVVGHRLLAETRGGERSGGGAPGKPRPQSGGRDLFPPLGLHPLGCRA